jgi:hypothetical protein
LKKNSYREGHFHLCHRTVRDSGPGGLGPRISKAHIRYVLRSSECQGAELWLPTGLALTQSSEIRSAMYGFIDERDELGGLITRNGSRRVVEKLTVALPHDLSKDQGMELVRAFAHDITRNQVPVLIAPHWKRGNFHAHLVFVPRMESETEAIGRARKEGKKFVRRKQLWNIGSMYRPTSKFKTRDWLRMRWRTFANSALREAGSDVRICHLSYARRGVLRQPGEHIGPERLARELRIPIVSAATQAGGLLQDVVAGHASKPPKAELQEIDALLDLLAEHIAPARKRQRSALVR